MPCTPELLDQLRRCGDPETDEVLAPLIRAGSVRNVNEVLGGLTRNSQPVPEQVPEPLRHWLEEQGVLPARADRKRLDRASQFFVKHGPVISLILGTASLVELYACAKGVKVLAFTGRLWRNPYRRIGQTVQFLLDVMDPHGLGANGRGIRSIQKVRLMHAAVRNLIWASGEWDEDDLGTPINQEELLGTLMTFSYTVCHNLKRFDIAVSDQEAEDFLYFWGVVGEMLGIRPELIPSTMAEAEAAAKLIFARQQAPSPEGVAMTQALLKMYTSHDPTHLFSRMIPGVIRYTVGDQVADWMEVPAAKWGELVLEATHGLPMKSMSLLGRHLGHWMLSRGALVMEGGHVAAFDIPDHLRELFAVTPEPKSVPVPQKAGSAIRTFDDVLDRIDGILETCIRERSPIGYFAAVYRGVTTQIKNMTEQGAFDDGDRMERLDVTFAGRYFDAYDAFRKGGKLTESWAVSFRAAASGKPTILQHLLMGMNAHINLDLGIATAQTCPGPSILDIRQDFIKVNQVMAQKTDAIDQAMAKLSPISRFVERTAGKQENEFVYFDIMMARLGAWSLAEDLALGSSQAFVATVEQRDQWVAGFSQKICKPPSVLGAIAWIGRVTEVHDVRRAIDLLLQAGAAPQPGAQAKVG